MLINMTEQEKLTAARNIFQNARKRIENIDHWCQGEFAANSLNQRVPHMSPEACKWDVLGALWVETEKYRPSQAIESPFYDKRFQNYNDIGNLVEGILVDICVHKYGKMYASEINDFPAAGVKELNDTSHMMKPLSSTHKKILDLYDECINDLTKRIK